MLNLKVLNKKEVKEILSLIEKQWNVKLDLELAFLKNNKGKVFLMNGDVSKIDFSKLRINGMGMYFCELDYGIRLSIEGSQLIGPKATKNILEISKEEASKWLMGEDIETTEEFSGFVIIKSGNDFLGTGKSTKGKILNYVSKDRRVSAKI